MQASWIGTLLVLAGLTVPPRANAQDAKAAETFVRGVYQRYQTEKNFSPFAHQGEVDSLATPALAALFRRDQETSHAVQDESELDSDPVSGSQDPEGLQVVSLKVETPAPGQAVVTATLRISQEKVIRRLVLLAVKGAWRIDDLTDAKGGDDLRAILKESIALHTPAHKH